MMRKLNKISSFCLYKFTPIHFLFNFEQVQHVEEKLTLEKINTQFSIIISINILDSSFNTTVKEIKITENILVILLSTPNNYIFFDFDNYQTYLVTAKKSKNFLYLPHFLISLYPSWIKLLNCYPTFLLYLKSSHFNQKISYKFVLKMLIWHFLKQIFYLVQLKRS